MFESNGYVYGGQPQSSVKVKSVKPLKDKKMIIEFSTGETRLFDASILAGPVFEILNEQSIFENARVEYGVVTWNNGSLDCAPQYMYAHSYTYAGVS